MSKKVLVTGTTGFVGSYLCRELLKRGYEVHGVKRSSSPLDLVTDFEEQIHWHTGDILDIPFLEDAVSGMNQVFHCAAVVSFNSKDKELMHLVNETGTANVVNSCLHHQVSKLIYVSSIAAIGRPEHHTQEINEATKWVPSPNNTAYAISKFNAEREVWRGHAEGLQVAIVNPSIILGSGFWDSGSGRIFSTVYQGLKYYPSGATGFVDVRDVARMMIELAESDISGQRFILNGANLSWKEILDKIANELNTTGPSIAATPFLQSLYWRLESVKSLLSGNPPLATKETMKTSALSFQYNSNAIQEKLATEFISIDQTISDTCSAFLAHRKTNRIMLF